MTLTTFTPAEAEAITGVSTASQRDWRRRGFLASGDGHARFDAFDLARMLVIRLLSDRGIGPTQTAQAPSLAFGDIASICAVGALSNAFSWVDAWEGDLDEIPTSMTIPEDAEAESFVLEIISSNRSENIATVFHKQSVPQWRAKKRYLIKQLWRERSIPLVTPGSMFIWWANGEHKFANSLESEMAQMFSSDPRTCGPIVVLDYNSLASMLIERSGRALCHVEIASDR
ncbi:MerR family transcriptional regulator [Blastomonas sp. SL216]|uniref:MerR family transcriptional regulator n=1 Tax=Blastomonas sp. SL216 TaxID=2995169 RepID=UPI002377A2B5|nr:hypothetical protein OU999_05505 [Blastomonas sp. SL216]